MIVRSIVSRHGRRALVAPALRSCHRFVSTNSLVGDITLEQIEEFNRAAALRQVPIKDMEDPINVARAVEQFQLARKTKINIGGVLRPHYIPQELIKNPPWPEHITLELLMASQTHMGHHTSLWNPANARYIYGVRQGIHLISLETTAAHLRRAARVVEEVAYRGGIILYVGTRNWQMEIVTNASKRARQYHLFSKWTPGNITNRDIINRGKGLKVVDGLDQDLAGFERYVKTTRPLVPDLVVCLNPLENYTMLYECGLANIPTIGVIDTNANPDWVTYTIPANDDSFRSIAVIGGVLGHAGEKGWVRRRRAARNGVVEWETPTDTRKFMETAISRWGLEKSRWMAENAEEAEKSGAEKSGEELLLEMVQAQREMLSKEFLDELDTDAAADEAAAAATEAKKSVREQLLLDPASQAQRRMLRQLEAEAVAEAMPTEETEGPGDAAEGEEPTEKKP